jgi:SAM-dependent methyltransferase
VDVRQAAAEQLPFPDDTFGVTLAQLVVHFMADPVQGLREMRRVTRPGGTVAACVWDHAGDRGPLAAFWSAVRELDPAAPCESDLAGVREGQLASLFTQAGLGRTQVTTLTVRVRHADFDAWWQPYAYGGGSQYFSMWVVSSERQAGVSAVSTRVAAAGLVSRRAPSNAGWRRCCTCGPATGCRWSC